MEAYEREGDDLIFDDDSSLQEILDAVKKEFPDELLKDLVVNSAWGEDTFAVGKKTE